MQIINEPYTIVDWDNVPITKHSGETGYIWCRAFETENIRIRLSEYSPGFKSDHWCCRGHIIHIINGEMSFEFKDGTGIKLLKGMSCCFSDSKAIAHRPVTVTGALILLID